MGFPGALVVKHLLAIWETQVQSLGWEDSLEKGMATHSSILAREIPDRGAWWATIPGVAKTWTQLIVSTASVRLHSSKAGSW